MPSATDDGITTVFPDVGARCEKMLELPLRLDEIAHDLNTFALSHFCENARWALDYKGVSYAEVSWAPMLHMLRTWRL